MSTIASFCAGVWQLAFQFVISLHPFIRRMADLITSCISSVLRLFVGGICASRLEQAARPQRPLKLFEYEGCPYSRKVREALSILDLEYEDFPCPPESLEDTHRIGRSRFRPALREIAGKVQTPCLVDENAGIRLLDSDAIIQYLWNTYGVGCGQPANGFFAQFDISSHLASILRPMPEHGQLAIPSKVPQHMLIFYQYESSPFCRLIREALTCLEIPYRVKPVAYGSSRSGELSRLSGRSTAPFLIDPNTNFRSRETLQIVKYLWSTYKIGDIPRQSWFNYNKAQVQVQEQKHAATPSEPSAPPAESPPAKASAPVHLQAETLQTPSVGLNTSKTSAVSGRPEGSTSESELRNRRGSAEIKGRPMVQVPPSEGVIY